MSSALYECTFEPGGWNEGDWIEVRSPRWEHPGGWLQQEDHVSNRVPADATAKEMLGPRDGETYSSMLVADLLGGDMRVRTSASFDFRMAPLIVFAGPLGIDRGGHPEYLRACRNRTFRRGDQCLAPHLGRSTKVGPGRLVAF